MIFEIKVILDSGEVVKLRTGTSPVVVEASTDVVSKDTKPVVSTGRKRPEPTSLNQGDDDQPPDPKPTSVSTGGDSPIDDETPPPSKPFVATGRKRPEPTVLGDPEPTSGSKKVDFDD